MWACDTNRKIGVTTPSKGNTMKYIINTIFIMGTCLASNSFSSSNIYLKDTDCMMIGSNGNKIVTMLGSLIEAICIKNNKEIICSNTTEDGTMLGHKASSTTVYHEDFSNDTYSFWNASGGQFLLNYKSSTYSYSSYFLGKSELISKNCIGIIKWH